MPPVIHENEERKRHVRVKQAVDSAKKLRRNNRLTTKEENFVDMVSKAINAKAASFDMSAATADLAATLSASDLVDHPKTPRVDADALDVVAHAGSADKDDVADVSDEEGCMPCKSP
jgi:hypothetical protein